MEEDIERICSSLKVQRMVQRELEKCGRIDSNSCGYCLGEGVDSGYVKLPCGHYHHRSCVKFALRKGIIKCADCGDCIVKSKLLLIFILISKSFISNSLLISCSLTLPT